MLKFLQTVFNCSFYHVFIESHTKEKEEEEDPMRTSKASSFPSIEFSDDIIRLPRSFGLPYRRRAAYEPSSLIVSPQHEYRSSSISYPSLNDFYSSTKTNKQPVKKTHSDGCFVDLLRDTDPQDSPLQGTLSPEELQSHMTDILEYVHLCKENSNFMFF